MATTIPPLVSNIRVLLLLEMAMNTMTPIEPAIGSTIVSELVASCGVMALGGALSSIVSVDASEVSMVTFCSSVFMRVGRVYCTWDDRFDFVRSNRPR